MKTFSEFGITGVDGKSGEIKTTCPKCSPDRKKKETKCLNVNIEKGIWHCWHCDWAGGIGSGQWQPPSIVRRYSKPPCRVGSLSAPWQEWLAKRGISIGVATRNCVENGSIWMPQVEFEIDAIMFPYFSGNECINIKYRDRNKNFRMYAGAQRILYGVNDIYPNTPLIIVEGEMDKLSCEEAGHKNCVSVPDGAPAVNTKNYESKFDFLADCADKLKDVPSFIIAVDNDAPGRKLQEELVRRLGAEKCFLVSWPEGCKDANDVLVKGGPMALDHCIKEAKPSPISGIFHVSDFIDQIYGLYEDGAMRGKHPGWNSVADLYTVREGEWTVVTGIPGHGKSEWVDALMVNLAISNDWGFAICSPENQPLHQHFAKIAEKVIGKPFNKNIKGHMSWDELEGVRPWIDEKFSFILPEDPSLKCILDLAKVEVYRRGIKGLVIDPWNELDHSRVSNLSETEYISYSLSVIRKFARAHRVHVWVIAHPTKLYKDKDGVYPIPTPYDISGSAHWRNKADNAITVWRNVSNDAVQIHVQKVRFKQVGRIGRADLRYNTSNGRYFEEDSQGVS